MGYGIRFLKKKEKEEKPVREKQTAEEIYGMPEGADLNRHLQNMGQLPQDQGREATRKLIQYAPKQAAHQGYYQNKQNSRENRAALDSARRLKEMKSYRQQLLGRLYGPNSWDEQQIAAKGAENWRRELSQQVDTLDQRIQKMQGQQQQKLAQAYQQLRAYQSPQVEQAQGERQRQKELKQDRENRLGSMEKTRQQLKDRLLYPTKADLEEIDRAGQQAWQKRMQQDLDYLEKAIGKLKGQQGQSSRESYQQLQQAKAAELEDVLLAPDAEETIAKAALKSQNLLGGNYKMRRAARYLTDPAFRAKGQTGAPSLQQAWDWLTAGQAKENSPGQRLIEGLAGMPKEDLDFLTEQEKNTLLYYAGKGDWATMAQYYGTIERQIQQRRQESANQWAEEQANRHKVAGVVTNIGASLFSPLAYGEALGQALTNKITGEDVPLNTASPLMAGAQLAQATQQGITRDMGPAGQFLTGTGLSIGQNLARMPLGPGAALGSMALGAAGSTALEAAERGAGAGQAAALGTLAGAAEALTEKIPLDNLFRLAREGGGEGLKGFLRSTLEQMGSEAAEEVISEYANRLADNIILSDQSEMAEYIRQLMDQGASAEQAQKAAAREFWLKQPALAGLGGALSGGILGSGAQALNKANSAINRFLQGPQKPGLPNPPAQVTMEQNKLEAARRRFLRKEAANGGEIHEDVLRGNRSIAPRGEKENLIQRNVGEVPTGDVVEKPLYQQGGMGGSPAKTESKAGKRDTQSGGRRERQVNDYLYRYEETPQKRIIPEVQGVVDGFLERGVKSVVYDGIPTSEHNGKLKETHAVSSTLIDGSILISSDAANSGILRQIIPHEMIHSVKKTNRARYDALEQKALDIGIDINGGVETLEKLIEGYDFDENIPTVGSPIMEELLAQLSGIHFDDPDFAREIFGPVFQDYDAVVAALEDFDAESLQEGRRQANSTNDSDQNSPPPPSDGGSLALTQKGSAYLSRAEKQAADTIAKAMNIPKWAKRETLGPAVRQLAQQLARDGQISSEAADSAFEAAYEQGLVVLDDFARQYDGLRRDLQRTRFQLSDQDRADIADYGDFRRRNFGRLNIVNQGGTPVDIKYQELAAAYPELFDPEITHPADQLLAIEEVRNQMDATEMSLDQYYGPEAGQYKEFARYEFDQALEKLKDEAAYVRRYEDDRARRNGREEAPEADIRAIKEAYARNRQLTKASEKAAGKYLLTEGDRRQIDRLLKGDITPEQLPQGANRQGILEVYRARKAQQDNMEPVRQYRRQVKEARLQRALELAEDADSWQDKKLGLTYSRETAERNMRDIMGEEQARAMIDEYFWPVHQEEAEKIRLKNRLRDRIRDLKLSQKAQYQITYQDPASGAPISGKVSESALVQLLGEKIIGPEAIEACGADVTKIQKAVEIFRQTYDELFGMAEEALIRNGYPPPGYIQGYFPHFQEHKPDGRLARMMHALGFGVEESSLPTEIAGQTHTFKPGKKWTPNLLERTGVQTEYDAIDGFDRYLQGMSDVIYHTDNIQRLRGLESALRYKFSDEGTKAEIDQIRSDRGLDEQTREAMLEQLYGRNKSQLPNLVTWLRNYTDILAGKKHPSDRQAEHELGRWVYDTSKKLEGRVAANMVAANIGSATTNFIPLTQGFGQLKARSMLGAMRDTLRGYVESDGFVDGSTFLTNRRGSELLTMGKVDKASAKASLLMEGIDNFTSEVLTRARYRENLDQGMDLSQAMQEADEWAAGLMADRSKGAMPTIFEQKNPLIKALNMFQLEVNNQLSYIFKDMPREAREKGGLALALWMAKMFFGAWLYNEAAEKITGRRPALDPASILMDAYQDFTDPDTKTSEALGNLGESVAEQLPFIGGLMGGGRLPISSALPDLTQLVKLADGDIAPEKKKDIAKKELLHKPVAYLAMPFGGGQLKKSVEAFQTLRRGGSYARNSKGEEQLRFLTNNKKPGNWVKGALFGQYALPEAQKYVAGGFKNLSAKQTKTLKEAEERGMDPQAVLELMGRLKQAQAEKDPEGQIVRTENQVKRRIIRSSGFSAEEKSWLDKQLLSDGFFMQKEISADYSSEAALRLSEYGNDILDKGRQAEQAGIGLDTFLQAYEAQRGLESDKAKDGQPVPLSKMKKRKAAIDKATPNLKPTQRRRVYEILGISEKVW